MAIDKVLQKTVSIRATAPKVWETLTNPEKISKWLYGTQTYTSWNPGTSIRFTGKWEGREYEDKGRVLQFEPEKIMEYSYWSGFSGLPDEPENYSILTFELRETSEGTDLSLSQRNFATEQMCEDSNRNWDETLKRMKEIIENE